MSDEINYYDVLGIPRDASTSDVIKSYWHAKDRYDSGYLKRERDHAKRNDDAEKVEALTRDMEDAPTRLREIEEAYIVLSSYIKRKAYDIALDSADMSATSAASDDAVNVLLREISADVNRRAKPQAKPQQKRVQRTPKTPAWYGSDPFDEIQAKLDSNQIRVNRSSNTLNTPTVQQKAGMLVYKQSKPTDSSIPPMVWIFAGLIIMTALGFFVLSVEQETTNSSTSSQNTIRVATAIPTITPQQITIDSEGIPTLMPDASTFAGQAEGYYMDGRYRIAVTVYSQAIAQQEAPQLYYGRAQARWAFVNQQADAADTLLAISDLEQAIALDSTFAEAYGLLGVLYFERWKIGTGDDQFEQAQAALMQYLSLHEGEIPSQIEFVLTQVDLTSD